MINIFTLHLLASLLFLGTEAFAPFTFRTSSTEISRSFPLYSKKGGSNNMGDAVKEKSPKEEIVPMKEKEPQILTDILPYLPRVGEVQLEEDANYMKMALVEAEAE